MDDCRPATSATKARSRRCTQPTLLHVDIKKTLLGVHTSLTVDDFESVRIAENLKSTCRNLKPDKKGADIDIRHGEL